jgi:hypothetical protein
MTGPFSCDYIQPNELISCFMRPYMRSCSLFAAPNTMNFCTHVLLPSPFLTIFACCCALTGPHKGAQVHATCCSSSLSICLPLQNLLGLVTQKRHSNPSQVKRLYVHTETSPLTSLCQFLRRMPMSAPSSSLCENSL